jgi:arabinofuranosyltransferase
MDSTDDAPHSDDASASDQPLRAAPLRRFPTKLVPVALLPALVLLAHHQLAYRHYLCDDAFISFRYARNLLAGLGLTFNPGERVEGFSNPLWTALLALAGLGTDLPLAAKVMGFASACGLVAFAALICAELGGRSFAAVMALGVMLAANAAVAYHSAAGMETIFFGFLLTAGSYYCLPTPRLRHPRAAALLLLLAALTRPEGIALLLLLTAVRLAPEALGASRPAPGERAALGAALLGYGGLLSLRRVYYGDWLPNPFYAKPQDWLGQTTFPWGGLGYIHQFLWSSHGYLFLLAAAALVARGRGRRLLFPAGIVGCGLLFALYANTDWMRLYRFLVPYLGLVLALGVGALFALGDSRRWRFGASAVAALGAILLLGIEQQRQVEFLRGRDGYPQRVMLTHTLSELGRKLRAEFPLAGATSLATKRIGAVGYYSGMTIVDLYGLTDARLARIYHSDLSKGDRALEVAQEVVARKPDLILLYVPVQISLAGEPTAADVEKFAYPDRDVLRAALAEGYRLAWTYPTGGTEHGFLFRRPR